MLEVPVPLNLLHTMFSTGVKSLSNFNPNNVCPVKKIYPNPVTSTSNKRGVKTQIINEDFNENDQEINLSCYILMLDILMKQFELQEVNSHKGPDTKEAQLVLNLILEILRAPWVGTHTCREINNIDVNNDDEAVQCLYCEMCAIWYQLALSFVEYFCPLMEVTMADVPSEITSPSKEKNEKLKIPEETNLDDTNLDENSLSKDISNEIKYEDSEKAKTLEEPIPSPDKIIHDEQELFTNGYLQKEIWKTSQGNFTFAIKDMPPQFQLVFEFLKEIRLHDDADVLYHLLYCLKLLTLHSEILNKSAKNYKGFLIWCQENLLIPNLWSLLQSEFSQISQLCVPLLLHCITLPFGAKMFYKVVENDFKSTNWRVRFIAVERVITIAHFVDQATVKNSPLLQSSLANAFCYLVHCLDDIEPSISQRALLCLEQIKTSSLKLLIWCLEVQFDIVLMDRPMILTTIFHLYNHLSERRFLNWDFFLNRFDTLFLEMQVNLEKVGELIQTRDLKNTNVNSEVYQKKVSRAYEALSNVHASRCLSSNFGLNLPYKRNLPIPLTPTTRLDIDKQRQFSTPIVSRKTSKFAAVTGASSGIPEKFQQHFPNSFFHDNQVKEIAQEENQLIKILHRNINMEDHDYETMHLLIFLLMQFFSRSDQSHPQDEKTMTRSQVKY